MNLSSLLRPAAVAVVGASEREGSFGGDTCRNMMMYAKNIDHVYFVNPTRDTVFGRRCWNTLSELPEAPELIIVCLPQDAIPDLLREAASVGCRAAVVFASGYGETGPAGKEKERALTALCDELGIALMGPNCAGFANFTDGVYAFAFITEERDRCGNIGLVSQSGQICLSALDSPGLGFSHLISCGNSAAITVEDYLGFLVDDPDTRVVACYIEGIRQPARFVDALRRAAEIRKPVVVLKSGRSQKAVALASSHTGSLAGSDRAVDAVLAKYGALRVDDLEELLATAHLFSVLPELPAGPRWASFNVSGGEAGITADIAHLAGIPLADFSVGTLARLRAILPSYATPGNPLDMSATLAYVPEKMAEALRIVSADPGVDALIMGYTIPLEIIDSAPPRMIDGIALAKDGGALKPLVWIPFVEHTKNPEQLARLLDLGVPALPCPQYAYRALRNLERFRGYDAAAHALSFAGARAGKGKTLSEYESMTRLAAGGVLHADQRLVRDEAELAAAADALGFPLRLKISSADIPHKSDIGGVKLNLKNMDDARAAYSAILDNAAQHAPDAIVDGVLVAPMLDAGLEMIVGVTNDAQFGPMVLIGMGGVLVEILQDAVLCPAPVSPKEAAVLLRGLKSARMLDGYRGSPPRDVDALADFIARLSQYAFDHADTLHELDINPLFVYEQGRGVAAADALMVCSD